MNYNETELLSILTKLSDAKHFMKYSVARIVYGHNIDDEELLKAQSLLEEVHDQLTDLVYVEWKMDSGQSKIILKFFTFDKNFIYLFDLKLYSYESKSFGCYVRNKQIRNM